MPAALFLTAQALASAPVRANVWHLTLVDVTLDFMVSIVATLQIVRILETAVDTVFASKRILAAIIPAGAVLLP